MMALTEQRAVACVLIAGVALVLFALVKLELAFRSRFASLYREINAAHSNLLDLRNALPLGSSLQSTHVDAFVFICSPDGLLSDGVSQRMKRGERITIQVQPQRVLPAGTFVFLFATEARLRGVYQGTLALGFINGGTVPMARLPKPTELGSVISLDVEAPL